MINYVIYNNVTIVLLYFCVQTKEGKIMTFSEAYDKLYPREESKQDTSVEDEKMVDTDADGTNDDEANDEEK